MTNLNESEFKRQYDIITKSKLFYPELESTDNVDDMAAIAVRFAKLIQQSTASGYGTAEELVLSAMRIAWICGWEDRAEQAKAERAAATTNSNRPDGTSNHHD